MDCIEGKFCLVGFNYFLKVM